ncbi:MULTISPECIES: hypothetical protein [unclassified Exiguobacterium]|uniref:hypothetical protein n=1 Tax=unclassified Exiguobacterium TaxID=2644629 RepID=UPI00103953B2|nr:MULTISPECIES: hypothetical protein [unclassified Exiguobacterium]TCI47653.1 hypothetical protein EVJ31_01050 [Exiguobacterium sp. SH5S32]TCI54539.1 hypothetical protein EVJ25_01050 [Exiguobacterium sp. SH1S4]TCI61389.1 hypothetical protein EVJ21_08970 [Exiguobacterium sp. SH0S2]TCI74333.1 hypothetical protein EVJ23_01050 [Exiguobacterium sp. SH1S1]TCI80624.1 hypothetical protein EVJ20_04780 [Exiguobacterium sp. SH0S1]
MKRKDNSKRTIIQWIAFAIVILGQVIRLVLEISGLAQNLSLSTLNAISLTGFAIGIILILVSFLFPNKKKKDGI